jgi:hypothetical protein
MNMEILHTNLPSITELQMHSSFIAPSGVTRDIEPATPITSLFFSLEYITGNIQSHIEFYKYLAKKYPSTNDFICFDCELRDRSMQYVCDVFDNGIIPFLEQVGPQLEDFSFESYVDAIAAFGRIDELGCKFKELTINSYHDDEYLFEELTESDQAKTIEVLELNDTVPNPAEYLINMEVLRFLRIDCSNSNSMGKIGTCTELDLNKLLKSCPTTLTRLITEYTRVKCVGSRVSFTAIQNLTLSHVKLTPVLAKTLETSFPKLLTLELDGLMASNITISLPNHKLKDVCITTTYKRGRRNAFSIKTMNNGKLEYYAFKQTQIKGMHGELKTQETIQLISKEEVCDPLMLDFTCASVDLIRVSSSEKFDNY